MPVARGWWPVARGRPWPVGGRARAGRRLADGAWAGAVSELGQSRR